MTLRMEYSKTHVHSMNIIAEDARSVWGSLNSTEMLPDSPWPLPQPVVVGSDAIDVELMDQVPGLCGNLRALL